MKHRQFRTVRSLLVVIEGLLLIPASIVAQQADFPTGGNVTEKHIRYVNGTLTDCALVVASTHTDGTVHRITWRSHSTPESLAVCRWTTVVTCPYTAYQSSVEDPLTGDWEFFEGWVCNSGYYGACVLLGDFYEGPGPGPGFSKLSVRSDCAPKN